MAIVGGIATGRAEALLSCNGKRCAMCGKKNIIAVNSTCWMLMLLGVSWKNGKNKEGDYCREHDKKEDCLHFCHMVGDDFQPKSERSM
jgi:hypothetical protein